MFNLIFRLINLRAVICSSNETNTKNQLLNKFINSFDDNTTIDNWIKVTNNRRLYDLDLFKQLTRKVKDIISVINTEKYTKVKSFLMKTNLALDNIRYPYLETFNIISSVKRILIINDKNNVDKSKTNKMNKFNEEILYEEYEQIHSTLNLSILEVLNQMNYTDSMLNRYDGLRNIDFNSEDVVERIFPAIRIYDLPNYMISSILPVNIKKTVYIVTNFEGLKSSRKCFNKANNCFNEEKSFMVSPSVIQQYLGRCHSDYSTMKEFNMDDFINLTFKCNRTIVKILIMLFHYYSEIMIKSTKIKILLKENDEYQIKWSISKNNSFKEIKKYWMQREVSDSLTHNVKHEFGSFGKNEPVYSTKKSNLTESSPINARLILLSCGHQLGFKLIDALFKKQNLKNFKPFKCPLCQNSILIIGSYDRAVYKYKNMAT